MFLKQCIKRNPELLNVALQLHQNGMIQPDTYVIDYDQTLRNAKMILEAGQKAGIKLYFMLKQVGRNPLIARALMDMGYSGAVVVDYREANLMMHHQIPLGNVGHLVQTPKHLLEDIIRYGVEVITVFSMEKLKEINAICHRLGIVQDVILKVFSEGDLHYPGQEGGIDLTDLPSFIKEAQGLKNVSLVGATAFPAFLFDCTTQMVKETHNYTSIMSAIETMKDMGCTIKQINAPSTTSVHTLSKMTGVTHGEPGHGLTGTTPAHAVLDLDELPAVVYVSEVSHSFKGKSYCYGGGHYRRSHVKEALCHNEQLVAVEPIDPENIDYYFTLDKVLPVSSTVIMAYRFQIFVTRSQVAIVKGIGTEDVEVLGIYDSLGKKEC